MIPRSRSCQDWGEPGLTSLLLSQAAVPSAGWNQTFLLFTQSSHPFIYLSILLQSLLKAVLRVRVRDSTDRQTLFLCQGAYNVLIYYNMLPSIEFAFLLNQVIPF